MGTATTTCRPLDEWSNEELVYLEEMLTGRGGTFPEGDVVEFIREGGNQDMAAWYDYHLGIIERLLNEAGIRMIETPSPVKDDPFGKTKRHRDFDALYGPQDRSHLKIVDGTGDSHV